MSHRIEIGRTGDLPVGRARVVDAGGQQLAVYHTEEGFFATDNVCPHRGGPLGEGDLAGNEITCPWHLWSFDVKTGVCMGNSKITIATHEVRVEGDRLMVTLP